VPVDSCIRGAEIGANYGYRPDHDWWYSRLPIEVSRASGFDRPAEVDEKVRRDYHVNGVGHVRRGRLLLSVKQEARPLHSSGTSVGSTSLPGNEPGAALAVGSHLGLLWMRFRMNSAISTPDMRTASSGRTTVPAAPPARGEMLSEDCVAHLVGGLDRGRRTLLPVASATRTHNRSGHHDPY
jgi:hypothetical protein